MGGGRPQYSGRFLIPKYINTKRNAPHAVAHNRPRTQSHKYWHHMNLCRVTGTVVSTRKSERFRPAKLLVVQPIDLDGGVVGRKDLLALDPGFDAGVGDVVLIAKEGAVVAQLMDGADEDASGGTPANVIIVAVVDDWQV